MFEAMGGRKLVFGVLITLAGVALIVQGKLTAEATAFLLGMYATFAGANVIATVKSMSNTETPPATPFVVDTSRIEGALQHLIDRSSANEQGMQALQGSQQSLQKAMAAILSTRQQ
jgi:hypothetical protein